MRTDLPSGAVTFLVSDVEGSTRLLHALGSSGYAAALAEHRRVVRAACTTHGGVEVDTQGDAFLVAFSSATGAVAAAHELTEALAAGPIRVRVGIHTGSALVTDEGYVGEAVHLAARVASAGHGGQVLVSGETRALLDAPERLLDLGEHRLKDIAGPVALYQLGDAAFPTLRTISITNLPHPASTFIGRERELNRGAAHLRAGSRLLTLTGPGGSGKTRLAIELARGLVASHGGGVFWVELAAVRDPVIALESIGQVVGAKGTLAEHVGERRMVFVLDNLEQVIDVAADLADLVATCPNLVLIVTSRERLRVDGEVEYRVPPLAADDGVELFSSRSGLTPGPEIAALCRALDDLPLAIELAAARTTVLSPAQILDRVGDRLDLLRGGRDSDPRQRTLRATIEWSHDLLTPDEQALFRRSAVFAGAFSLSSAEAIVEADLDELQSLVDKSLLAFDGDRFRMLETIREFAREELAASPEGDAYRQRHVTWFAAFVEATEPELDGPDQELWLGRLAADHDEIRAALTHARGDDRLRLAGASATFWWVRGHWTEGRRWLDLALAGPRPWDDHLRAHALEGAAHLAMRQLDIRAAIGPAEESLSIRRRIGDESGVARSLRILGLIASVADDAAGFRRYTEESAVSARRAGDVWALSMALNNLGYLALSAGDLAEARELFDEALSLARGRGDQRSQAFFLENRALTVLEQGWPSAARSDFVESLGLARRLGFVEVEATDLVGLAAVAVAEGDHLGAARLLGFAARLLDETGGRWDPVEDRVHARTIAAVDQRLGGAALAAAMAAGRAGPAPEIRDRVSTADDGT